MKKHLFFVLMLMALSLTATAQNKKIAILETVDKKGNVPYGVSLQLRSNLTYAISNTPGYEGYDRVDMASIVGEHDFQRTGLVSDEQIRQLGIMTGCDYILVAEAAVYDVRHILITAKILNIETASVERSVPPQVSSTDPDEMQLACVELANMLLGFEKPKTGLITKAGSLFYLNGQRLTEGEYMELIMNCPEAWLSYEKGCKQRKTGWGLLIGGPILGVGIAAILISQSGVGNDFRLEPIGICTGVGIICGSVGASIALLTTGKNKKENCYKVYNEYCAQPKTTLSFGPATNGVGCGLYLNF